VQHSGPDCAAPCLQWPSSNRARCFTACTLLYVQRLNVTGCKPWVTLTTLLCHHYVTMDCLVCVTARNVLQTPLEPLDSYCGRSVQLGQVSKQVCE
jgi:hypothetical protein